MVDETKFRPLLNEAQRASEQIRSFLAAVADAPASAVPDIAALLAKTRQQLEEVEQGVDQLWDLFKRQP